MKPPARPFSPAAQFLFWSPFVQYLRGDKSMLSDNSVNSVPSNETSCSADLCRWPDRNVQSQQRLLVHIWAGRGVIGFTNEIA